MKVVYDLRYQPFSVGDILLYQQASLLLTDEPIDFVVTYDPEIPTVQDRHLAHITKENVQEHFRWLMPAARVNQRLNSVELRTDVSEGWPDKSHYMYYECMEVIRKYFEANGKIEAIKPSLPTQEWAEGFLNQFGYVTVQLRSNPHWLERNSDLAEWFEFFMANQETKFVVVCSPSEIDDDIAILPNVTFACDYVRQNTEKICALIEAADIHMGVNSGPACMRLFSQKPFCLFKDFTSVDRVPALRREGDGIKFAWSTDQQTMLPFAETAERIQFEFDRMNFFARTIGKNYRKAESHSPA